MSCLDVASEEELGGDEDDDEDEDEKNDEELVEEEKDELDVFLGSVVGFLAATARNTMKSISRV